MGLVCFNKKTLTNDTHYLYLDSGSTVVIILPLIISINLKYLKDVLYPYCHVGERSNRVHNLPVLLHPWWFIHSSTFWKCGTHSYTRH